MQLILPIKVNQLQIKVCHLLSFSYFKQSIFLITIFLSSLFSSGLLAASSNTKIVMFQDTISYSKAYKNIENLVRLDAKFISVENNADFKIVKPYSYATKDYIKNNIFDYWKSRSQQIIILVLGDADYNGCINWATHGRLCGSDINTMINQYQAKNNKDVVVLFEGKNGVKFLEPLSNHQVIRNGERILMGETTEYKPIKYPYDGMGSFMVRFFEKLAIAKSTARAFSLNRIFINSFLNNSPVLPLLLNHNGDGYFFDYDMHKFPLSFQLGRWTIPIIRTNNQKKMAILINGTNDNDPLSKSVFYVASKAYIAFIKRGYKPEEIVYYDAKDKSVIENAINEAIDKGVVDLSIFISAHSINSPDFYTMLGNNYNNYVYLNDWKQWFDRYQIDTKHKLTLIFDSCWVGAINADLRGFNRSIIASAESDELAYFGAMGMMSFGSMYFTSYGLYGDKKIAFGLAKKASIKYTRGHQHAVANWW